MNKLPVGATIRFAYGFTFGEIGTVIGLLWIPTLIQAVASFFVLRAYCPVLAQALETGGLPTGPAALLPLPFFFLSLLVFAMNGAALTRQILGLREGSALAYFSLGWTELKIFAGYIAIYVLAMLFLLFLGLATGVLAVVAARSGAASLLGSVSLLLWLVGLFALVFAVIRLSFLLIPAVLGGADIGLIRSWQLTEGNFWRILLIGVACVVPLFVALDIANAVILGPGAPAGGPPPATMADLLRQFAADLRSTLPHMPVLAGIGLVAAPLTSSLMIAPAAFAYRALSGKVVTSSREVE